MKESIRDIGSVLLVMTPWDDPIPPVKRVWCLFEMYSAIDVQADMHIAFPFFHCARHSKRPSGGIRRNYGCSSPFGLTGLGIGGEEQMHKLHGGGVEMLDGGLRSLQR